RRLVTSAPIQTTMPHAHQRREPSRRCRPLARRRDRAHRRGQQRSLQSRPERYQALDPRHQQVTMISIRATSLGAPAARALITAPNAELKGRYPEEGATHFRLDEDEVGPGRGVFLVAYRDGEPTGCGAVRKLDAATAELKRMYVAPVARGLGIGRQI